MSTTATEPENAAGGQTQITGELPKDKTSQREYVILEQRAKDGPWVELKRVTAGDVDTALNSLPENSMNQGASYVAVAERYWQPKSPKVETQTTITWS